MNRNFGLSVFIVLFVLIVASSSHVNAQETCLSQGVNSCDPVMELPDWNLCFIFNDKMLAFKPTSATIWCYGSGLYECTYNDNVPSCRARASCIWTSTSSSFPGGEFCSELLGSTSTSMTITSDFFPTSWPTDKIPDKVVFNYNFPNDPADSNQVSVTLYKPGSGTGIIIGAIDLTDPELLPDIAAQTSFRKNEHSAAPRAPGSVRKKK